MAVTLHLSGRKVNFVPERALPSNIDKQRVWDQSTLRFNNIPGGMTISPGSGFLESPDK